MLVVVPVSNDYRLLVLVVAVSYWLATEVRSDFNKMTFILFGVLFSAHPLQFAKDSSFTIGGLITFPILLFLLFNALKTEPVPSPDKPESNYAVH